MFPDTDCAGPGILLDAQPKLTVSPALSACDAEAASIFSLTSPALAKRQQPETGHPLSTDCPSISPSKPPPPLSAPAAWASSFPLPLCSSINCSLCFLPSSGYHFHFPVTGERITYSFAAFSKRSFFWRGPSSFDLFHELFGCFAG